VAEPIRQILATSGGFVTDERGGARRGPLIDHALRLAGKQQPRMCFLATAMGDNPAIVGAIYGAFAGAADAAVSHLSLFPMPTVPDPREHGVSAGSMCWHVGGTTDSFGPDLQPVRHGLGLLPHSNGVHYDSEQQRRPLLQWLIGEGVLPDGYASDDGVGLHYIGTELHEVLSDRPDAAAYRIERTGPGTVRETRLSPRLLAE
jgi:hypothetical protein